jgi:hypothetical protein
VALSIRHDLEIAQWAQTVLEARLRFPCTSRLFGMRPSRLSAGCHPHSPPPTPTPPCRSCIQIEDLVDEEEVPAAAARGVANVLMVFNTDLRALYDKYW